MPVLIEVLADRHVISCIACGAVAGRAGLSACPGLSSGERAVGCGLEQVRQLLPEPRSAVEATDF